MDEFGEYVDTPIGVRAMQALGLGFDLASDFRLKFVKRSPNGGRLVVLDEKRKRDVVVPGHGGGVQISDVPECIRVDKGDHIRFKSDVLPFNQGIYLPSFNKQAIFIQTRGTHIIVGMAVGGQDLVCVKQRASSPIPSTELKGYLDELGDSLFSDANSPTLERKAMNKQKKGFTLIWSKLGGDLFAQSHSRWLQTKATSPDAVVFKFVPTTSLLNGIPGSGYLSHAINLYLRYKPPVEDLQYFLEFQVPRQWVPLFGELPLRHQRSKASYPLLQFSFLGPKVSRHNSVIKTTTEADRARRM